MIEQTGTAGNRSVGAIESASAAERSKSTQQDQNQESVQRRERKDTASVSPEARALLDAEQREKRGDN